MGAMGALVAERGYPAVTVTDVVAAARVSKRTFYEHFADREACFLATYADVAERPLARIAEAVAAAGEPVEAVEAATRAYLDALSEQPALTRTFLTEISALGPRGWEVRREVLHRFADQLAGLVALLSDLPPLPRPLALALVGGINELVLDAVESGRHDRLGELAPTVTELVLAVLRRPATPDV